MLAAHENGKQSRRRVQTGSLPTYLAGEVRIADGPGRSVSVKHVRRSAGSAKERARVRATASERRHTVSGKAPSGNFECRSSAPAVVISAVPPRVTSLAGDVTKTSHRKREGGEEAAYVVCIYLFFLLLVRWPYCVRSGSRR